MILFKEWWMIASILSAFIVAKFDLITSRSEDEYFSILYKLVAVLLSTMFFYVLSQTLCTKSKSMNTHFIVPSVKKERDSCLKYCVLRIDAQSDESTFEWVKEAHMEYLEQQITQSNEEQSNHDGAYSVARTVDKYHIFQFEMHLNRFLSTIQNIKIPHDILRKLFIIHLRNGLDEFYNDHIIKANEARILIFMDSNKLQKIYDGNVDNLEICIKECLIFHFGAMPTLQRPISAVVRIGRHIFAKNKKSTKWTQDRNKFKKEIDERMGFNEVIMTEILTKSDNECNGYLVEGLSSNFGVIQPSDLSLLTPSIDDGILSGTVRKFVVEIMKNMDGKCATDDQNMPKKVVFGKPLFSDILNYKGMVIMSTSRLLLPIDYLYIDIDDDVLLKLIGNDIKHSVFDLEKCKECGLRKIAYKNEENGLENLRLFIKNHLKTSSLFIGSVLQNDFKLLSMTKNQ